MSYNFGYKEKATLRLVEGMETKSSQVLSMQGLTSERDITTVEVVCEE